MICRNISSLSILLVFTFAISRFADSRSIVGNVASDTEKSGVHFSSVLNTEAGYFGVDDYRDFLVKIGVSRDPKRNHLCDGVLVDGHHIVTSFSCFNDQRAQYETLLYEHEHNTFENYNYGVVDGHKNAYLELDTGRMDNNIAIFEFAIEKKNMKFAPISDEPKGSSFNITSVNGNLVEIVPGEKMTDLNPGSSKCFDCLALKVPKGRIGSVKEGSPLWENAEGSTKLIGIVNYLEEAVSQDGI
ncbi:hypothetical protein AYI68_g6059, partial [Smittium mucronatum]